MKYKLVFFALLLGAPLWAQQSPDNDRRPQICQTDSTAWNTILVIEEGRAMCQHKYVYSESTTLPGMNVCTEVHGKGCHCDNDDSVRKCICARCGRHLMQRQRTYQSPYVRPETEYEKVVKRFNQE